MNWEIELLTYIQSFVFQKQRKVDKENEFQNKENKD